MKCLISMIFAFAMMGAILPMISCSDNEEKVLENLKEYSIEGGMVSYMVQRRPKWTNHDN